MLQIKQFRITRLMSKMLLTSLSSWFEFDDWGASISTPAMIPFAIVAPKAIALNPSLIVIFFEDIFDERVYLRTAGKI